MPAIGVLTAAGLVDISGTWLKASRIAASARGANKDSEETVSSIG